MCVCQEEGSSVDQLRHTVPSGEKDKGLFANTNFGKPKKSKRRGSGTKGHVIGRGG